MRAKTINENNLPEGDDIFHVYSGLDAFVIHTESGDVYCPYIAVIAINEQDARKKAALICGQKLEDQETNPDYDNYVSKDVEHIRKF
jgi:hypothetical protein